MKTPQPAQPSVAHNLQPRQSTILFMFGQERITIDVLKLSKRFTCPVDPTTSVLELVKELLDELYNEQAIEVYDYQVRVLYAGKVYEWSHFGAHKCFDHGSVSEEEFAEMIGFVQPNVGRA